MFTINVACTESRPQVKPLMRRRLDLEPEIHQIIVAKTAITKKEPKEPQSDSGIHETLPRPPSSFTVVLVKNTSLPRCTVSFYNPYSFDTCATSFLPGGILLFLLT